MFRVFYNNNEGGAVRYITNADETVPTGSLFDYIDVEFIPEIDMYRQELRVHDGELIVVNYDLSPEQEREIERMELMAERSDNQQYLMRTDYIAAKLGEAAAYAAATGDNEEVLSLRDKYADQLAQRALARMKIDEIDETLKSIPV